MLKPLPPTPARGIAAARFLSFFAFAVLVEAALARRFDLIDTLTLYVLLALVLFLALPGLVAVAVGLRDVWRRGALGFSRLAVALIALLIILAPFAGAALALVLYPPLHDVSTDPADPPLFRAPRLMDLTFPVGHAPPSTFPDLQSRAYPDILPREFVLSTVEAHAVAHLAALELGWSIKVESEPSSEMDEGAFEAVARSFLLGIPDDVAVRIRASERGARIDVRSASRFPAHDLGENARRIRTFLDTIEEIATRPALD